MPYLGYPYLLLYLQLGLSDVQPDIHKLCLIKTHSWITQYQTPHLDSVPTCSANVSTNIRDLAHGAQGCNSHIIINLAVEGATLYKSLLPSKVVNLSNIGIVFYLVI